MSYSALSLAVTIISLVSLLGSSIVIADETKLSPPWATLRPQSLISARLPVPHSPHVGFLYHPAGTRAVRHVAEQYRDEIRSFTFTRHTSRLGEQRIVDVDANVELITSLLIPSQSSSNSSTFSLRVDAAPLDPTRPVSALSLVFYAATGPDELSESHDDAASDHRTESTAAKSWGQVKLPSYLTSNPDDPATLTLSTPVMPDELPITLYPPRGGDLVPAAAFNDGGSPEATSGSQGSRAQCRVRAARPPSVPDDLAAFRVAAFNPSPSRSWALETELSSMLRPAPESAARLLGAARPQLLTTAREASASAVASGVFVQRVVTAPFSLDVTAGDAPSGSSLDTALEVARAEFDGRFERTFGLAARGLSSAEVAFGKETLSGLLGGIGYFYGSSEMKNNRAGGAGQTKRLPPVSLMTATPSRALFPRGFLWDEGFHQLLVLRWDPTLSRRCLTSWFKAARPSGWIPREQILGLEARARFPEHVRHLMLQNPEVANPPTILIPLQLLWQSAVGKSDKCSATDGNNGETQGCNAGKKSDEELEQMFARVEQYYNWLKKSQAGEVQNSFRWRGRTMRVKSPQGYPLTLSSGLDDYPRGQYPSEDERHVDLHSWVAWAARMLARISELAGKDASKYWRDFNEIRDALLTHHGVPTKDAISPDDLLLCDFDGERRVCNEGYVTILPMALGLLEPDDPRVEAILDALEDEERLQTTAGVRSLSKSSRWYRKGDDYWTGSVWMPFNYLTLASLKTKYSVEQGPYRERASKVYEELRKSVLQNAFSEYSRTGQLWENYSPEVDGHGKSGRQFTGWSSLVLLIYAEMFDGVAT